MRQTHTLHACQEYSVEKNLFAERYLRITKPISFRSRKDTVFDAKERHKGKDPLDPSGKKGKLMAATVALRRRLGVTPADMVRIERCRPNVRSLARRVLLFRPSIDRAAARA